MRASVPADARQQQAWLADWKRAIAEMHYLKLHRAEITQSLKSLIQIKGGLRKPNLNIEFIKPDVLSLWKETSSEADEAAHCIWDSEMGFEFEFYAVASGAYITGSVIVQRYQDPNEQVK